MVGGKKAEIGGVMRVEFLLKTDSYSNIETRMDRPKSVVRVIRGVA